jgi:adenylate cyclase
MAEERVQRRLAAILAADVVGYSRMMSADEPGTLARLRTLRSDVFDPAINKFTGRIFKTTGDGALAEFASAVDAVQCAVEIQQSLANQNEEAVDLDPMKLRIGISLGDVMIEGDDLFGNGVNVAARMEGLAEAGGICISGTVQEQIVSSLAVPTEDLGEQSVKNIDRPIRCFRVLLAPAQLVETGPIALLDKPSIAVLPFANMSGDSEQEYFADGITEDIITELSRFRTIFVIARNSSFAFKGKSVDIPEVAQQLGVQYVLEGSIRKAGRRVRITAQLIDASTGAHVWADRYDREFTDIFELQDELTRAIVAILPGRLEDAGRSHSERKRTTNMSAYDLILLGNEHLRRHSREEIAEAIRYYQNAIDLDPSYARAHASLAWANACFAFRGSWTDPCVDVALRSIEKSISLDDDDSWSHGIYSQILIMRKRYDEAEIQFERALALNPNDAEVAALWSPTLVYLGRWEEGLEWIDTAKRLNPYPGQWYYWYRGFALFSAREYEQAAKAIMELTPVHLRGHAYIAASYGYLEKLEDARKELSLFEEAWDREKSFIGENALHTIQEVALDWAARYRKSSDGEHFLNGLRKAGWEG